MIWFNFNYPFHHFLSQGKSEPGILIEVLLNGKKQHLLIGDLNTLGSMKEGQSILTPDTMVLRYRRIWSH